MNERPTPETDAAEMPIDRIDTVASRPSCVVISDVARRLERERDETLDDHRFLLREIFNLTQIGDPHPADLPMRALQAIAEMIDEQWKGQSK